MKVSIRHIILSFLLFSMGLLAKGQFYNGLQMTFGKNRLQHYDFYWSYYRFDYFDVYFNEYGRDLARYTAKVATEKIAEIEDYFDYILEKRLIFITYNLHQEQKQTNIGLVSGQDDYNIGGFNRAIKNKVMLYYEGDHERYKQQIASSITEVMINEMLYDAERRDMVSGSSQISLPDWYLKGLINYIAKDWDYETDNMVRDGILSGRYEKLNFLEYDDAVYAGHSFWRYVARTYGDPIIPNVIYLTKIYKNVDDGLMYVLGMKLKDLQKEWYEYYKGYYEKIENDQAVNEPENKIHKTKKRRIIQDVSISPDHRYIAYITYDWGKRRIFLHDTETGRRERIFTIEPKYEQVADISYPVLAWHPSSKILTFINEEKGDLKIYFHRITGGKTESRNLLYFEKVLDFSYSPNGNRLVLSAVKDGLTDIYVHTIAAGTNEQITRDLADDLNPRYVNSEGNTIIFSSNRLNDTLDIPFDPLAETSLTYDLFTYDLDKDNKVAVRLSEGRYIERMQPATRNSREIYYLGDQTGTINKYLARFDSTISYIDTTTHYRYFIKSEPVTNYNRNIIKHDYKGGRIAEIKYRDGSYHLYTGQAAEQQPVLEDQLLTTPFRKEKTVMLHEADSIDQLKQKLIEMDKLRRDTLTKPLYEYYATDEPIDINYYIFEKEKENYYEQQWREQYMDIDIDTAEIKFPLIRIYETSFYNNYIANQIDFNFLNQSYQAYRGGAPYFNPGFNMLTQIGIVDLFEDYKITGGFRFAGNFDSNEYLVSLESLKGKFDKQFVFHRQALSSYNGSAYFKIHSHNLYFTLSRPITPVLAIKGTLSYRNDRYVALATDIVKLNSEAIYRNWAGLKSELVYDNTRKRGTNIYFGTRFKIFGEYYRDIKRNKSDMFVVGGDFRHYLRIHRDLIWANRFAASSSFGPTKLLYYLGGVDNWLGFLSKDIEMFDNSVQVDPGANYGFQTLATNMRGFSQNIRNGNNFALINSEIRWPVIRYIAGRPLKSKILNDFQVVAFGDLGTAWTGPDPWSGENKWDTETIENGPVKVHLDTNREPVVGGFGFGLRVNLFGYFVRADWAWGVENSLILPGIFYLSLSLDF
ncbi:MAG TPA: hypothetical protein ENH59_07735 [Bacteroidetes bacterium]|nr:hypothetical protein [Bacteroidota bacterium]